MASETCYHYQVAIFLKYDMESQR